LIQRDFEAYEKKKKAAEETTTTTVEEKKADGTVTTTTTTTTTTKVETVVVNKSATTATTATTKVDDPPADPIPDKPTPIDVSVESDVPSGTVTPAAPNADSNTPPDSIREGHAREGRSRGYNNNNNYGDSTETKKEDEKGKVTVPHDDSNSVYVGLRVYTHKDAPAVVVGRLKPKEEVKSSSSSTEASGDKL